MSVWIFPFGPVVEFRPLVGQYRIARKGIPEQSDLKMFRLLNALLKVVKFQAIIKKK